MFQDPASYGYLGITLFLILTGCGLPLPEEVAIIAAGVAAASPNGLNPWGALAACLVGAIVGDTAMYLIGRRFGKGILERHPIWAKFINPEREKQIEVHLTKHGAKMILLARFLIGLRSPFYFAAGVLKVNYLRFLITDTICALFVVSLFFGLTYFFGRQIWAWIHDVEVLITIAVVLAIVIGIVIYFVHRRGKRLLEAVAEGEAKGNDAEAPPKVSADAARSPTPSENGADKGERKSLRSAERAE
ncbi:MAG TPA: DedA family protein [Pirellulales bacterium]|nr:DedA family protein [Pirellulales bacterium]